MLESPYKTQLDKTLTDMFPGCIILKNDAGFLQGVPDRTIFFEDRWATLEAKRSAKAPYRPNQPYYVDLMNRMSFSAFIYPENEEEILNDLQHAFLKPRRAARNSKRE